jgi:hypothetical protein
MVEDGGEQFKQTNYNTGKEVYLYFMHFVVESNKKLFH